MRNDRLALWVLSFPVLFGAFGLATAACGGSGGSGAGGSTAGDCYDYTTFDSTSPATTFMADVVPIFQGSCALSTSCHGCDGVSDPGCTNPGIKPFLGVQKAATLTAPQLATIIAGTVGQPANAQPSTIDPTVMVGNPNMSIIVAGSPQQSFMMYKLDGDPTLSDMNNQVTCATLTCAGTMSCGAAMPSGGPQLAQTERDTIRRWIAQGATND
jgi:hypothetical protein